MNVSKKAEARIIELGKINHMRLAQIQQKDATIGRLEARVKDLEAEILTLTQERSGYAATLKSLASKLDEVLRRISHDKRF